MNNDKAIPILNKLGHHITVLRKLRGWSQEELANYSGLHRTYISSLERGHRNPTITSIHSIASALGISLSEFFNYDE
jgi:transcriptional regulator with XRE-family HTH domain